MNTIGFRASPTEITFAVFDTETNAIVNIETIKIPLALTVPDSLKYIRSNLLDILREYSIARAGIRITESIARANIARVQIEGVIQEAFASSQLEKYYAGQISSITARLGIPRADFKRHVSEGLDFERVANWNKLNAEKKEAVLCALGAINA